MGVVVTGFTGGCVGHHAIGRGYEVVVAVAVNVLAGALGVMVIAAIYKLLCAIKIAG